MPDRKQPGPPAAAGRPFFLSKRQRQVLALAAQGLTYIEIGRQLFIQPRTASRHLELARQALGAINTPHAVAIAMATHLISFEFDRESV